MTPECSGGGCRLSLEELGEHLHAASPPHEAHLRDCPECRARVAALSRLDALSAELVEEEIRQAAEGDQSWLENVLANLCLEPRAGGSVPLAGARPHGDRPLTEGSIISLIRATGDAVDGTIIGKCRLHGELAVARAPVRVEVSVAAVWGYPLPVLAADLRDTLSGALATHTDLNVSGIDIIVTDLLDAPPGTADS